MNKSLKKNLSFLFTSNGQLEFEIINMIPFKLAPKKKKKKTLRYKSYPKKYKMDKRQTIIL